MKRMTFTMTEQMASKLKVVSAQTNVSMSRMVENALWVYIMMATSNQKQTDLLNQQFDNLREELDERQMTIDDVLNPLKPKK